MAKPRKPTTARKPPVPSDSRADIEDWIRRVMPDLHPIVKGLDELICEAIPGLQYAVKWKKAYYGLSELGWIIEMVAYDVSVNVVFFGGAEFDPPPPLGTTERTRYVKLTTLEEAQGPEMHTWIEQAGRVPGWNEGPRGEDATSAMFQVMGRRQRLPSREVHLPNRQRVAVSEEHGKRDE